MKAKGDQKRMTHPRLMFEHPLHRKDFDPYLVQMKIGVGFNKSK